MTALTITANLDIDPWTDITVDQAVHNQPGPDGDPMALVERVGVLPEGMASGNASVSLLIRLPDGTPVLAQTSLALFRAAAAGILATPVAQMENW